MLPGEVNAARMRCLLLSNFIFHVLGVVVPAGTPDTPPPRAYLRARSPAEERFVSQKACPLVLA
ncbi:MAG TPA: hypothetical protein DCE44_08315 [Verrucomicrobiales bacterium]|nr:hypothetical protein [Verrucomicrobiales bacterium]